MPVRNVCHCDAPPGGSHECEAHQLSLCMTVAEQVFADRPCIETASAGMNRGADTPLSAELVEWADVIFVMEKQHKRKLADRFKAQLRSKRVVCLGIPDNYQFMQTELIDLLEAKVARYLR